MSQSYRLRLTRQALKLKIATRIPAQIEGSGGISVVKTNGVYTISPDAGVLGDVTGPGAGASVAGQVAIFTDSNNIEGLGIGAAGTVITSDGAGASWEAAGGTPGGSDTQVQFNNAGSFGGISGATTNGTILSVTTAAVDTNTMQAASTAMVLAQAASATPLGSAPTAVVGTSTRFARADHVHPGREILTANRTYYIRADGSDSNDGLADTSGGAFLTKQYAYDLMCATLDKSGYDVYFQIADSTAYTDGVLMDQPWTGGGAVIWQGNSGTPANVRINVTAGDCFKATGVLPGTVMIKDMELRTTTTGNCINQSAVGLIQFQNIVFGAAQVHLNCGSKNGGSGANLECTGNYTVSGAATFAHLVGSRPCNIDLSGRTITFSGTPALNIFILLDNGAICYMASVTWGSTFTGKRYQLSNHGVCNTGGQATTWIPGTVAGTGTNAGTSPYGLYV